MLSVPLLRRDTRFRADSSSCHQLSSHQKQISEREQRKELSAVLGEAAIAGLHMAKLAFDDPEGMLDLGPHLGDDAVGCFPGLFTGRADFGWQWWHNALIWRKEMVVQSSLSAGQNLPHRHDRYCPSFSVSSSRLW